jgi:MYXO-CTERM domain-containing protein
MVQIRNRLGMLACAAALSLAGSANAATFDISYMFTADPGTTAHTVTGTVDGTADGSFIDNLSNIHLFFDGAAFTGSVSAAAWDPATTSFDAGIAPRISTDAASNEFLISDSTGSFNFGFINDDSVGGQLVWASNLNLAENNAASDSPANASWSVVPAPVPEPAPIFLALAGLAFFGFLARRRSI